MKIKQILEDFSRKMMISLFIFGEWILKNYISFFFFFFFLLDANIVSIA